MSRVGLLKKFDRFLFDGCTPMTCSVIRIAYALLLLVLVSIWWIDAETWFTERGVLTVAGAQQATNGEYWSLLFWFPEPQMVTLGLSLLFAHGVLLLLGCWSRWQSLFIFVWLTSFQHRNPLICDGEDAVFRLFAFFMMFMPLDYAWSLRRFFSQRRHGTAIQAPAGLSAIVPSAWALRLMQFEITAIYFSTAISKWHGETWRDGTALYYVSRMDDVFGRLPIPGAFFEVPWLLHAFTWGVLGLESLLPFMLWCPPTRRLAIAMGIALHLSIEATMHLFLFEWIMIVGLFSFVRLPSPKNCNSLR